MRTFGVEEEFFIIEPLTGLPCAPPERARAQLLALTAGGTTTVGEFLACQVESNSPVFTARDEALADGPQLPGGPVAGRRSTWASGWWRWALPRSSPKPRPW